MWEEYYTLLTNTFPNLPPDFSNRFREVIPKIKPPYDFFFHNEYSTDNLLQGDLIGPIQFYENENEQYKVYRTDAIVISNTCDLVRKRRILLCPAVELDEGAIGNSNYLENIQKNKIYEKLYLPGSSDQPQYIIDLNRMFSVNRKYIENLRRKDEIKRIASLSQEGYFFFGLKITVYLLRPETDEVTRHSNKTK